MKKILMTAMAAMAASIDFVNQAVTPQTAFATGTMERKGFGDLFNAHMTDIKGPGRREDHLVALMGTDVPQITKRDGSMVNDIKGPEGDMIATRTAWNDGTSGDDMTSAMIGDQGEAAQHGYHARC